jgi:hypothetical protein
LESIVLVQGIIKPAEVKSCTIQDYEVLIKKVGLAPSSLFSHLFPFSFFLRAFPRNGILTPPHPALNGQIHVIVEAPQRLPFGVEDASRPEADYEKVR